MFQEILNHPVGHNLCVPSKAAQAEATSVQCL